jgi:mannose-6-phosphate isomerase-like protein (cupin superfamily)
VSIEKKAGSKTKPRPAVESADSVPALEASQSPIGVKLARVITRTRHNSEITLGVCWVNPGEVTRWWSFEEEDQHRPDESFQGPKHETYFIVRGRLRLTWNEGAFDLKPNDAVYLAPGWHYQLQNIGDEPAFFVFNVWPTSQ